MQYSFIFIMLVGVFLAVPDTVAECLECWWETPVHEPLKNRIPKPGVKEEKDKKPILRRYMPSARRHYFVMQYGLEARYQNMVNPFELTKDNVRIGEKLYNESCLSCHGPQGYGDGSVSTQLTPEPADLHHLTRMSMMTSDSYLYWTIAEGGVKLNTSMPPYKATLSDAEIWKIIVFIRQGL